MTSDDFVVVVDAAREVLRVLSRQKRTLADATFEKWLSSSSPLLRRIAVDGVRSAEWMTATQKLRWLLDRDLLFDLPARHEVYGVLADTFEHADTLTRQAVIKRAQKGARVKDSPRLDKGTRQYLTYNLLAWLRQVAPRDEDVQVAFDRQQEDHPEFAPRPDPDLLIGEVQAGFVRSSMTTETLLAMRAGDVRVARRLLAYKDPDDWTDRDRYSFLRVIGDAVAQKAEWGVRLAKSLVKLQAWDADIWRALADGWARGKPSDAIWNEVFEIVSKHRAPEREGHSWARLLTAFIESRSGMDDSVAAAEAFSVRLWDKLTGVGSVLPLAGPHWLTSAINTAGGAVVEFWIRLLSLRLQHRDGKAMPDVDGHRFQALVAAQDVSSAAGRILIASQFHFFLAIDRSWTERVLLPLFDWRSDGSQAEQAWDGYLSWARLNEAVIEVMLPSYVETFQVLGDREEEWRNRFTEHLAAIAVTSSRDPLKDGWLQQFIVAVAADIRAQWASHVAFLLREIDEEAKRGQWRKWVRQYWDGRLEGLPRQLTRSEAGEMAAWAVSLGPVFDEAVDLLVRGPSGRPKSYVYDFLDGTNLPTERPNSTLRLLDHVLAAERRPFYSCPDVVLLLSKIAATERVSQSHMVETVNRMVGLGCEQALAIVGASQPNHPAGLG
jgi:hypothetical protein